jgi:hypothetical protein
MVQGGVLIIVFHNVLVNIYPLVYSVAQHISQFGDAVVPDGLEQH